MTPSDTVFEPLYWPRNEELLQGREYQLNNALAEKLSKEGYAAIIKSYVYIDYPQVEETLRLLPGAWEAFRGVGIDLGGGVGCISSTIARKEEVEKVYCVELSDNAVICCHPIVKKCILGEKLEKTVSVIGDFDLLQLEDNSVDFVIAWDAMHHSCDLPKTLKETRRVLKPGGHFVVADRAHDNATAETEMERMRNVQYSKEFLRESGLPEDLIMTRADNGEHEYRYQEWEAYFENAGFEIEGSVLIKERVEKNINHKNDAGVDEVFVDYTLGGFLCQKLIYLMRNTA